MEDFYNEGRENELIRFHSNFDKLFPPVDEKSKPSNLPFQHGSPSYKKAQKMWEFRYNAFFRGKFRDGRPITFNIDLLADFLEGMMNMMSFNGPDSVARITIMKAASLLHQYAVHSLNYERTEKERVRLKTWLSLHEDALQKGRILPVTHLTFALLDKMLITHFQNAIKFGTASFDQVLYEMFCVALVAGLACRGGEVACTRGYKTKGGFMKLQDLEVYLDLEEEGSTIDESLARVQLRVRVLYVKGSKLEFNSGTGSHINYGNVKPFFPLKSHPHQCPVTLLIAHAMRHGLIVGEPTTTSEFLEVLRKSPDRTLQWKNPTNPVVCTVRNASHQFKLNLTEPNGTHFVMRCTQKMASEAGIIGHVNAHSLKYGGVRDAARLERPLQGSGHVDARTQSVAQHSAESVHRGVTARYAGAPDETIYNMREDDCSELDPTDLPIGVTPYIPLLASQISNEEIQQAIQQERMQPNYTYLNLNNDEKNARRRAITKIKKNHKLHHDETVDKIPRPNRDTNPSSQREPLKILSSSTTNIMNGDSEQEEGEDMSGNDLSPTDEQTLKQFFCSLDQTTQEENPLEEKEEDEEEEYENLELLMSYCEGVREIPRDTKGFLDLAASVNVVANGSFAKVWSKYDPDLDNFSVIEDFCERGYSRSPPRPHIYRCQKTEGCTIKTIHKHFINRHQKVCSQRSTQARIKRKNTIQPKVECPDCKKCFDKDTLIHHTNNIHQAKICLECKCEFIGKAALTKHKKDCSKKVEVEYICISD